MPILYDEFGRPRQTSTTIEYQTYAVSSTYNTAGRVATVTYPSGFQIRNDYTPLGYLKDVVNATSGSTDFGKVYYHVVGMDEDLRVTHETYNNGVVTTRTFDRRSGDVATIYSSKGSTLVQDLGFTFDLVGNLRQRTEETATGTTTETFTYDELNRLKTAALTGPGVLLPTSTSYSYDDIGNLTAKSDVGTYQYPSAGGVRPHAVASITGGPGSIYNSAYLYDANGNMTQGAGRTIEWTAFNNVKRATRDGWTVELGYDPERSLVLRRDLLGGSEVSETHYIGRLFERTYKATTIEDRHFISAGNATFGVFTSKTGGIAEMRYLHTDHLGSVTSITNASGAVVEKLSYDPHGRRRPATWITPPPGAPELMLETSDRGFTGHRHMDPVGLIHMNGRVYDPTLGRFLSPDPIVQDPFNPQSLNRYSYVFNNPLSFTDPSGFFSLGKWFKKHWRQVVAGVVAAIAAAATWYVGGLAAGAVYPALAGTLGSTASTIALGTVVVAAAGAAAGATYGGISTGALRGAAYGAQWGAVSAAAAYLGGWVGAGLYSELRGGSFIAGFLATGLTSVVGGHTGGGFTGALVRSATAAVVGGTTAAVGGGKFADGAATSGFTALFIEGAGGLQQFAHQKTDRLKLLECSPECPYDDRGVLDTAGGREVDWTHNESKARWGLSADGIGMAKEGIWSREWMKKPLGFAIVPVVVDISKVHDWFNSWNYGFTTGQWMSRGPAFDNLFQVYSFSGMLPAAAVTITSYPSQVLPYEQRMNVYTMP